MGSTLYYFVEGPCEKALLKAFIFADKDYFKPGKIEVFNFVNKRLSKAKARTFNKNMTIVIVFDTDVNNTNVLESNLAFLKTVSMLDDNHIVFVPSIKNLEDELVYSCSKLKNINDLFKTKSVTEFKNKLISHSDIVSKLNDAGFDFSLLWSRNAKPPFDHYPNKSNMIKISKKK